MLQCHPIGWDGPGMFGYGRLVHETFDACILMLLQTCSKSTCSLADVHLSAGAWRFVDDICLLLHGEGVLDLSNKRMEGGSGLEYHSNVEVLSHPPDLLTNTSYVRWPLLLPFPVVLLPESWLRRQNG